jgi:hypothetical protein
MRAIIYLISLFGVCTFQPSDASSDTRVGGPHYFGSVDMLKAVPLKLSSPITAEDAKRRTDSAYFEAYFDDKGRILTVQKYFKGEKDWKNVYIYSLSGKVVEFAEIYDGKRVDFRLDDMGKWRKKPMSGATSRD